MRGGNVQFVPLYPDNESKSKGCPWLRSSHSQWTNVSISPRFSGVVTELMFVPDVPAFILFSKTQGCSEASMTTSSCPLTACACVFVQAV